MNWYKLTQREFRPIDPEEDWEQMDEGDQIFKKEQIRYDSTKNISHVAIENGVVIGALASGWTPSGYGEDAAVFSFDLVVKPEFRRQGVGLTLIQNAIRQYEQEKEAYGENTMMRLWVVNRTLIPVLENRFGFQMEAEHEGGSVHMVRY